MIIESRKYGCEAEKEYDEQTKKDVKEIIDKAIADGIIFPKKSLDTLFGLPIVVCNLQKKLEEELVNRNKI